MTFRFFIACHMIGRLFRAALPLMLACILIFGRKLRATWRIDADGRRHAAYAGVHMARNVTALAHARIHTARKMQQHASERNALMVTPDDLIAATYLAAMTMLLFPIFHYRAGFYSHAQQGYSSLSFGMMPILPLKSAEAS